MNCTECQDLFCKHRSQSTAGGQCFYESKEQMEKLLAITAEATFAYIDWNAFRREVAKSILPSIITAASKVYEFESLDKDIWCAQAVAWADSLIKQLKEGQK